ncbi:MAG: hypothetical protein ACREDT_02305 [Methylocella sp.]
MPGRRGVQNILVQLTGIVQAGSGETWLRAHASCLEGAVHLNRMVAGQRAGGKGKAPPSFAGC